MTRRHRRAIDEFRAFSKTPFAGQGISGLDVPVPIFSAPLSDPDNPLLTLYGGPLTMVRATTATFLHPGTGLITSAANNILRIEANGALIEGQRTNLAFPSTMETGHATGNIFGVSAYPAVDTSSTVSPDGSTDAVNLTFPAGATRFGTATDATARHIPDQNGNAVISLWMRSVVGTVGSVTLSLRSTITPNLANITPTLTTEWQRVSKTRATVAGQGTTGWYLYNTGESEIEVWGANFEAAAFPSSYIPTVAAAVTRNADALTFPTTGSIDGTIGSMVFGVYLASVVGTFVLVHDNTQNIIPTFISSNASLKMSDGTGTRTYQVGVLFSGVSQKIGQTWAGSGSDGFIDGVALTGNPVDFDGDFGFGASMRLGSTNVGSFPLFGNIKGLEIYGVAFSGAQMIAKTY